MKSVTQRRLSSVVRVAACPRCGYRSCSTSGRKLQVEMRPILTDDVPQFPDALAEIEVVDCAQCGYLLCLGYSVRLDDNPEIDLNEK